MTNIQETRQLRITITRDYQSNKLFKLKSNKLMTNTQETYQLRVIIKN